MFDIAMTDQLLTTTRSVRRRLDLTRPVEPEVILECLRIAVQAPTASNQQDWRWVVVTDPDKRAALASIYTETGGAYLAMARENQSDDQTRRVYESAFALTEFLADVPVFVIPCMNQRVDGAPNAIASAAYASIIPAAWSFMLALRARGLGSVWTTLHQFREAEAAKVLGIPDNVTQVALLPVAYTVGTDFKPATRPPVSDITYWNDWGQT